jgi:hypothetical protein
MACAERKPGAGGNSTACTVLKNCVFGTQVINPLTSNDLRRRAVNPLKIKIPSKNV